MPGAIAPNLHEGSRSEILADYLFSTWGTVTPVRRQAERVNDIETPKLKRLVSECGDVRGSPLTMC